MVLGNVECLRIEQGPHMYLSPKLMRGSSRKFAVLAATELVEASIDREPKSRS